MPELSVVIVATDHEQSAVLRALVDGTGIARTVLTCANYPGAASDPVMIHVRAANPVVILVDIPADNPPSAMRAIELFRGDLPDSAVFAVGSLHQPQVIVNAMRAGAREFIERPTTADDLLEAFGRLPIPAREFIERPTPTTDPLEAVVSLTIPQHRNVQDQGQRGKVFAVANAIPVVNAAPDEPRKCRPRRQRAKRDFGPLIGLCLIILAWFPPLLVLVLGTSLVVYVLYRFICAVNSLVWSPENDTGNSTANCC